MHSCTCTNKRKRTQEKHIPIRLTKEKEYNKTWQKYDSTNWIVKIWKKDDNTMFLFYSHYLDKNLGKDAFGKGG